MNIDTIEKMKQPEFFDTVRLVREKLKKKLSKEEYELLYIALDKKIVISIRILDLLESGVHDYLEIAEEIGYSLNTIKHYIYVLDKIGFDISVPIQKRRKPTGRPRKLLTKNEKN
jgi:biotin operon repressor